MLRQNARLRREYLYKKAADAKDHVTAERKRKFREAVESGKPVPTELRKDADALQREIALDDAAHEQPSDGIDSEYFNAGVADPKVLITTSRDPSSKLVQFLKEVKLLVPNSQRMNRGGHTVDQIVDMCRGEGYSDLVVVQEHRGVPDGIVVSHMPYGPTAYFGLHNVVMRHDIQDRATVSEAYPHLVQHNLSTRVGKRVATILKHLFPVPKADSRRVVSMVNQARSARTDFALHSLRTCYTRYALAPLAALATCSTRRTCHTGICIHRMHHTTAPHHASCAPERLHLAAPPCLLPREGRGGSDGGGAAGSKQSATATAAAHPPPPGLPPRAGARQRLLPSLQRAAARARPLRLLGAPPVAVDGSALPAGEARATGAPPPPRALEQARRVRRRPLHRCLPEPAGGAAL